MTDMELVVAFHRWQTEGRIHPFTCRNDECPGGRPDLSIVVVNREPVMVCLVCESRQPLTGTLRELVEGYATREWPCFLCGTPLADGEAVFCAKCKPESRCERCGNYASICGHSLPFQERIKTVTVNRTSLR